MGDGPVFLRVITLLRHLLQQMPKQGHYPQKHRPIAHGRQPAMESPPWCGH